MKYPISVSMKPAAGQRKAAQRTIGGLWDAISRIIILLPPTECANYFSPPGCIYKPDWIPL